MRPETITRRPLHICIFADERSVHTQRWVLGLRGLGHRVDLITLIKNSEKDIGGISLMARSKISYLTKIGRLRRLVGKLNPDIFHAHYASSFGFLASFVDHPRKVLSVWGSDIMSFAGSNLLFRFMVRRALRGADRITATSRFLKAAVLKLLEDTNNIAVIPFGIDTRQFHPVNHAPERRLNIGTVRSLRHIYGIDLMIRAAGRLLQDNYDIELSVAGDGEKRKFLSQLACECGLDSRMKFAGFIENNSVPGFLCQLDIFVMPSRMEAFGIAALEASAAGLPVVATRVGGVPEVVVDNTTGFLVEPESVEQLAEAIEKLIKSPVLREKMGRAGREFVKKNYDWNDNLIQMQSLYYSLMA
jgi:glycosyltransferase involved in cell wall biosynthesis